MSCDFLPELGESPKLGKTWSLFPGLEGKSKLKAGPQSPLPGVLFVISPVFGVPPVFELVP